MQQKNIASQEENEFRKYIELVRKNYKLFIVCVFFALLAAYFVNRYSTPAYSVSSSILIKGGSQSLNGTSENDFLYRNIFGTNQNFQNELWIMKSYPVIENTVRNLDLSVSYYTIGKFSSFEAYTDSPIKVSFLPSHPQPLGLMFTVNFINDVDFNIAAEAKRVSFYNYESDIVSHQKVKWSFTHTGKLGDLIETPDLSFIIEARDTTIQIDRSLSYGFEFNTIASITNGIKGSLTYMVADRQATVIKLNLITYSVKKGIDVLNELMSVYSEQNLERKNHLANITVDYIEEQLSQISDSLTIAEDNLQRFRSSNRLLDISNQSTVLSAQYIELQNQLAELMSKKRYYDYVSELLKNDNYANMMLPASIGISDATLNQMMSELINAQAQRSNLIQNNQERNPLVQKLGIQIENAKKIISENINSLRNSTSISIDELNKRLKRAEAEMNRLPATQRQLGNIERKFSLNESIYNYLLEKHAEAKITKASNLPDDLVIEPARGEGQVSPNKRMNLMIAFFLGLAIPFGFVWLRSTLNNSIQSQEDIENITDRPVLGKILHNRFKTRNVVYEFPNSDIAESIRALRTNLDFFIRGNHKQVIQVTSSLENEGKSFIASNLAMSFAQLGKKTILVDCDLRKPKIYFGEEDDNSPGLSSFMIEKESLDDIILKSPHKKLDYITAGTLPPNPVELLALDKTKKLLTDLKTKYDIIILDTTPLGQVTDAYLLLNHSDVNMMVVRHGQSLKSIFSFIMKDLNQKNVGNTCVVLNDIRYFRDQYGYGYGYYNKKGFWGKKKKKKRTITKATR